MKSFVTAPAVSALRTNAVKQTMNRYVNTREAAMAVLRFSSLNALLSSVERLRAVTPKNVITPIEKAVALTTKSLSGIRRNDQNNGPTMAMMIRMIASLRRVI